MSDIWGSPAEIEGEDHDPLLQRIKAIVRHEINSRAVYSTRMYFNSDPADDRFVTVAYHRAALQQANSEAMDRYTQLENRIIALHQRLNALERPWWRRWLNR